jgi:hypothetical protein
MSNDPISDSTAEAICTETALRSVRETDVPLTCRQALAELLREVAATRDYPCDALRRAINAGYRALGEVQP